MFGRYCTATAAVAVVLTAGTASAAEATLKGVSAFAQGTNFSRHFERFIEKVNAEGKGQVRINYLGGGQKVMNPFELGKAISTGVVDIGNLPGAFYTNLMPEADALKLSREPMTALRNSGAWAYLNELHNKKVNAWFLARQKDRVPFHLYLNKKVDSMDLKGLKIRVTPIYRAFFGSMGATMVQTKPGDVFTALERGVVDGYGWPIQGVFDLGWHEHTKYRVDPGFYNAAVEILVNLDTWNKLTEAQKSVLQKAGEWVETELGAEDQEINARERERQQKAGIQAIAMDEKKYLDQAYASGWAAVVKASPKTGSKLKELMGH